MCARMPFTKQCKAGIWSSIAYLRIVISIIPLVLQLSLLNRFSIQKISNTIAFHLDMPIELKRMLKVQSGLDDLEITHTLLQTWLLVWLIGWLLMPVIFSWLDKERRVVCFMLFIFARLLLYVLSPANHVSQEQIHMLMFQILPVWFPRNLSSITYLMIENN